MGLHIQSLENIPYDTKRDYYIYLLDYGWTESLGEVLIKNYEKMADFAAANNTVIIRGTQRVHFEDEVLSWHHINGENAEDILPAILLTNKNPHLFRESFSIKRREKIANNYKLILIPLKKFCKNTADVIALIIKLFNDIKAKKDLKDFRVAKEIKKNKGSAYVDSLILEPAFDGNVVKYKKIIDYFKDDQKNTFQGITLIQKTVYPIHFEDRSGSEFERLVFAFLFRLRAWDKIEWLGQTGSDSGRDIWGIYNGKSYCYQCANYHSIPFSKVSDDIDKLRKEKFIPDKFIVVCGGRVSAAMRKKIIDYALESQMKDAEVWSGAELEERLRFHAPDLIQRFVNGEAFPETSKELIQLLKADSVKSDEDILEFIAECFDRPAFTTNFRSESNIPGFEKAITDTIEVLNTGIHRLRDGMVIRKIPSRHAIKDSDLKTAVTEITQLVINLRDTFVQLKNKKEIRPCGCEEKNCSVYFLSDKACQEMDNIRKQIFKKFKIIFPPFKLKPH